MSVRREKVRARIVLANVAVAVLASLAAGTAYGQNAFSEGAAGYFLVRHIALTLFLCASAFTPQTQCGSRAGFLWLLGLAGAIQWADGTIAAIGGDVLIAVGALTVGTLHLASWAALRRDTTDPA